MFTEHLYLNIFYKLFKFQKIYTILMMILIGILNLDTITIKTRYVFRCVGIPV